MPFSFERKICEDPMNNVQFQSKVHDLDLQNASRSDVHIPIESRHMICYFMAIVIFGLSLTIHTLFTVKSVLDLDLWNGPRSNVNVSTESPYMTCYFMTIEMFTLSVTISKMFIVEIYRTLTLEWANVNGKCAKWRPIRDLTYDCNSNYIHITYHFQHIHGVFRMGQGQM